MTEATKKLIARLEEIEHRSELATAGPWVRWDGHSEVYCDNDGENTLGSIAGSRIAACEPDDLPDVITNGVVVEEDDTDVYELQAGQNAEFIAFAREDIPALCKAVRDLVRGGQ